MPAPPTKTQSTQITHSLKQPEHFCSRIICTTNNDWRHDNHLLDKHLRLSLSLSPSFAPRKLCNSFALWPSRRRGRRRQNSRMVKNREAAPRWPMLRRARWQGRRARPSQPSREWHGVRCARGPLMQLSGELGSTSVLLGSRFGWGKLIWACSVCWIPRKRCKTHV